MKINFLKLTVLLLFITLGVHAQKQNTTDMKIGMTSIFVNDPVEAFKFYTETIGFVEVMFMPEAQLAIIASPEDKEGTTLLLEPNATEFAKTYQQEVYKAGYPIIIFYTNDVDAEYERLLKLGVKFKNKPTKTDWGTECIFDDTQGNWVQIYQQKK
jgi:predicted enzyme related to lactoylglutathione lyase